MLPRTARGPGENQLAARRAAVLWSPFVRRVSVVGNSGSGKSTLARGLAARLGVPFLELDSVFHQPGWEPLAEDEFQRVVTERASADGWVIDGNYSAVRPIVWARADTVVWLDPPRRTVMRQVAWRTVSRAVTRQELWNGNREPLSNFLSWDPEQSVISWAWHSHAKYRARYARRRHRPGQRPPDVHPPGQPQGHDPLPGRPAPLREPARLNVRAASQKAGLPPARAHLLAFVRS